jgi:hypothetical protein
LILIALLILALVLALWWFYSHGATQQSASRGETVASVPTPSQPSAGVTGGDTGASGAQVIENEVYQALDGERLENGEPVTDAVYIAHASIGNGVSVTITLIPPGTTLRNIQTLATMRVDALSVATTCENTVLASVPHVGRVVVLDPNGKTVSAASSQ